MSIDLCSGIVSDASSIRNWNFSAVELLPADMYYLHSAVH